MQVRFLTSLGTLDRVYATKEIVDLPEALAAQWISAGFCEPIMVASEPLIPATVGVQPEPAQVQPVEDAPAAPRRARRTTTKDNLL